MSVKILKTSQQAKLEKERNKIRCPECGSSTVFGTYHYESNGFLGLKQVKICTYRCFICECEFEIRE